MTPCEHGVVSPGACEMCEPGWKPDDPLDQGVQGAGEAVEEWRALAIQYRRESAELRAALYHLCGWVRDHARARDAANYPQQLIDAEDVLDRHAIKFMEQDYERLS